LRPLQRSFRDDDSYRPSRPVDNFRRSPRRSPPRRGPPTVDTYVPQTNNRVHRGRSRSRSAERFRARSRSPRVVTGGSYRERPRSPRREYSPRREDAYRRERDRSRESRYARSPPRRERSPPAFNRGREFSPDDSRGRSPPPKRERFTSPPRRVYEERPRAYRYVDSSYIS
jgi:hypothetical protein